VVGHAHARVGLRAALDVVGVAFAVEVVLLLAADRAREHERDEDGTETKQAKHGDCPPQNVVDHPTMPPPRATAATGAPALPSLRSHSQTPATSASAPPAVSATPAGAMLRISGGPFGDGSSSIATSTMPGPRAASPPIASTAGSVRRLRV